MAAVLWARLKCAFAEMEQSFTHPRDGGFIRGNRLPKGDAHRVRKAFWPFEKEAAFGEGKNRAPELIKPDRNNRGSG